MKDCPCWGCQIEVTQPLAIDKTSAGQSLDSSANNVRHNSTFRGVVEPESVGSNSLNVDELLAVIDEYNFCKNNECEEHVESKLPWNIIRAVVELHYRNAYSDACNECAHFFDGDSLDDYPCLTIQAIEKEIK